MLDGDCDNYKFGLVYIKLQKVRSGVVCSYAIYQFDDSILFMTPYIFV